MEETFDFVIVGNNIATLVAAQSLSAKYSICLINPTPIWGGHFSGKVIQDDHFDFGMNLFEFTSYNKESTNILSYNPKVKNDCGRFFSIIEDFIKSRVDLKMIEPPQMYLNGLYLRDATISNDFSELNNLPKDQLNKIICELENIVKTKEPSHASYKSINEQYFIENTYKDISIANHGETFHYLFVEPLCQKILNINSEQIPALFHRVAWAPLLYPETLLAFLKKEMIQFAKTHFHYPVKGYFGILAEQLLDEVKRKENIKINNGNPIKIHGGKNYKISLSTGDQIGTDRLIWAMDLGQYLNIRNGIDCSPFDKTSIALGFISIESKKVIKKFSVLNLVDKKYSIYRITNQTFCAGCENEITKMVIELNYNYLLEKLPEVKETDLQNNILSTLIELNIIEDKMAAKSVTVKVLTNALNLPTLSNFNKFQSMQQQIEATPNKNLMFLAQSSGYSTASLNDQIIQGLKIGALYK